MRYYEIFVTDLARKVVFVPNYNGKPGFTPIPFDGIQATYSSLNAGASVYDIGGSNPAALAVEMDISVGFAHSPIGMPFIQVHGIGLAEISQAANLQGLYISIYGGMARGLPLANPAQAYCLFSGQIWQCFGSWLGVDQSISFYVSLINSPSSAQTTNHPASTSTTPAPTTTPMKGGAPASIVFQWQQGQSLLTPLVQCLQNAFPQLDIVGAVHDGLVWADEQAETGYFQTFKQLAAYLNQKSLSIVSGYAPPLYVSDSPEYPGVQMVVNNNNQIVICDGTTQTNPKQILIFDLIGQPTWQKLTTVSVTTVLRGDLNAGDYVVMPDVPGVTTSGANGSNSQAFTQQFAGQYGIPKGGSIFTGTFQVIDVRHVGNSRNPDPTSWVTTFTLALQTVPVQVVANLPVLATNTVTG